MPEMNYMRKLSRWTLLDAADAGQLLVITCQYCNATRCYTPRDILQLRNNMSLDRLVSKFRCERCNRRDYMHLHVHHPNSQDFGKLVVRRLVKVKTVKVPVWEDATL
ncbi:hypothetical protein EV130_104114 [Rhizobium azibense]|uniref:Uncharacterized protein n=1 Tax=Rhizobium azibense TaxID=1136135 RepID=A0A4R3QVN9_9HYPH|nr:hypothetical protein [Rhizobium azibense]TCU26503.1 hypothetical protein EV130_104114 [Rhizobium azibense]